MKFSIIIPFQRGTEYLRDCLNSLNEQVAFTYIDGIPQFGTETVRNLEGNYRAYTESPYRDFEAIVVLDNPVDDVSELLDEFKDKFDLRVIKLEEGTGVSAARNAGIKAAKGDYLFFLDSDDFLYVSALFRFAEAAADAAAIHPEDGEAPDVIYGKKIWSWYSRSGFLAIQEQKKEERKAKRLERYKQKLEELGYSGDVLDKNGEDDEITEDTDSLNEGLQEEEQSREEKEDQKEDKGTSALNDYEDDASDDSDDTEDIDIDALFLDRRLEKESSRIEKRALRIEKDNEYRSTLSPEEYCERRRKNAAKRLVLKRKGIGNISALHIAFSRKLIEENAISFPEDNHYYADCPFLCEALYHAKTFRKCYRSRYVKRKHNDPINFPSLSQQNAPKRFEELIASYELTMDKLPAESIVRYMIDKKFIYYYTGFFVTQIRRRGTNIWRTERFNEVRRLMEKVPESTIKSVKLYRRRMIKALKAGDVDKAYKQVSFRLGIRKAWKCVKSRATRIKAFYQHVFLKKPVVDNWIIFECFFGKSYGDNPKGIYEYIAKNYGDKYKFIWSMENPRKCKIPYAHKTVKRGGLRYAYYVARCKYFVFNTKQPKWMKKRPDQIFLETWHGTPLKRLAFDMEDNFSASPGYKKEIYGMTRKWDYLVSANAFSTEKFRSCFMYKGKMLEYGYPRNDILHRPDRDELAVSIRKKLGIPLDKKTILYAPTWRDDEFYAAGQYKFTLKLELPKLREALGDEYVILLRTHYYIADKLDVTGMEGFAYNLSKYDDIADIYLISDICITDYSSVFFDYANLKRPMLFYTYDIDKYRDMLRGFYFDMESTVPGPLLYTTEEVIAAIQDIDTISAKFATRYDEFYERFCGWEDGHASENIVKEVILGER